MGWGRRKPATRGGKPANPERAAEAGLPGASVAPASPSEPRRPADAAAARPSLTEQLSHERGLREKALEHDHPFQSGEIDGLIKAVGAAELGLIGVREYAAHKHKESVREASEFTSDYILADNTPDEPFGLAVREDAEPVNVQTSITGGHALEYAISRRAEVKARNPQALNDARAVIDLAAQSPAIMDEVVKGVLSFGRDLAITELGELATELSTTEYSRAKGILGSATGGKLSEEHQAALFGIFGKGVDAALSLLGPIKPLVLTIEKHLEQDPADIEAVLKDPMSFGVVYTATTEGSEFAKQQLRSILVNEAHIPAERVNDTYMADFALALTSEFALQNYGAFGGEQLPAGREAEFADLVLFMKVAGVADHVEGNKRSAALQQAQALADQVIRHVTGRKEEPQQ